jgi:hypothetical protein
MLYVYAQRRETEATDKLLQIAKTEKITEGDDLKAAQSQSAAAAQAKSSLASANPFCSPLTPVDSPQIGEVRHRPQTARHTEIESPGSGRNRGRSQPLTDVVTPRSSTGLAFPKSPSAGNG